MLKSPATGSATSAQVLQPRACCSPYNPTSTRPSGRQAGPAHLVEQEHVGPREQRSGQLQAAPLAAAQRRDLPRRTRSVGARRPGGACWRGRNSGGCPCSGVLLLTKEPGKGPSG